MNASELFKAGKLQAAIDAQIKEVKASPADHAKRLFLFEMLAFAGDLDRARRQIEAINYAEVELAASVLAYKALLEGEQARRRLYSDGVAPKFFGEEPEHAHWRLEALNRLRENRATEAAQCLAKAAEVTPALQGKLNEKPFTSLRDCDDVLAGILEVLAQGSYYWVPLEQIEGVAINAPRFPRDLLWVPARLELADSGGDIFLPALYPGSHEHSDDQVKLGRLTDWKSPEGGPVQGIGLRTFLVDNDAVSLLEWRQLAIDLPSASEPPPTAPAPG
jgi:type VI secretion system protein ImpE